MSWGHNLSSQFIYLSNSDRLYIRFTMQTALRSYHMVRSVKQLEFNRSVLSYLYDTNF